MSCIRWERKKNDDRKKFWQGFLTLENRQAPRRSIQGKVDEAEQTELIVLDSFTIGQCEFGRKRPVQRIIRGRTQLVTSEIYRGPNDETPSRLGIFSRCEFDVGIHLAVTFPIFIA